MKTTGFWFDNSFSILLGSGGNPPAAAWQINILHRQLYDERERDYVKASSVCKRAERLTENTNPRARCVCKALFLYSVSVEVKE